MILWIVHFTSIIKLFLIDEDYFEIKISFLMCPSEYLTLILVLGHRKFKSQLINLYAGTMVTPFEYAITPTAGNWFQRKQPQHESDDLAAKAGLRRTLPKFTQLKRNKKV